MALAKLKCTTLVEIERLVINAPIEETLLLIEKWTPIVLLP